MKVETESRPRIAMVIDDNNIDVQIARTLIKVSNFADQVISEWSAVDALKFLKENEAQPERLPEVIFLDIRMPEMDGFGFLSEYHKLGQDIRQNVRIVMLSSSSDPEDVKQSEDNVDVYKFISKPLSVKDLNGLDPVLMFKNPGAFKRENN